MKIATWNLQRLQKNSTHIFIDKLVRLDADILVVTETSSSIQLENYSCTSSTSLPCNFDGIKYEQGEIRVSIFTKYQIVGQHKTFDDYTSICVDIETPFGVLTVYGGIVGVFGNRQPRFDNDLEGHLSDFEKIFPNKKICYSGDLNVTFAGRAWPGLKARHSLNNAFQLFGLINTTGDIEGTVDHIVLSKDLLTNKRRDIYTWNEDKKMSDHVGHMLTI